jgi:hypothetical protein
VAWAAAWAAVLAAAPRVAALRVAALRAVAPVVATKPPTPT